MRLVVLIPAFNDRTDLDRTLASLADDPQPFVLKRLALLAVPVWLRLTMKRIAGTVG